ncbi:MAG: exonuclease subunit SbcD [Leptospiraceae bacterium]|nr:exonuclease subunit SbcD [Leptospiraceae bacterium]MCP5512463.1 exonuclease subunit SbcD [Leptospiraceae bacterium]
MKPLRILHTGDWHLGKFLGRFSRLEEQEDFLKELKEVVVSQDIHLVLVAGDIYDNFNPPIRAQELFFKYCKEISDNGKRAICIIAGNHDSPERIEAPYPFSMESGVILSGYPDSELPHFSLSSDLRVLRSDPGFLEIQIPNIEFPVRILLTPYANEQRLKVGYNDSEKSPGEILKEIWAATSEKYCDTNGVNLLITHLFVMKEGGERPEEPEEEKSVLTVGGADIVHTSSFPPGIQYAALGHLHRYRVVSKSPYPIVYAGSPLPYSLKEDDQVKYFSIVEVSPGTEAKLEKYQIQSGLPIHRRKFPDTDSAIEYLSSHPDIYIELTLQTEDFIRSEDHRRLRESHPRIINIIPEIKNLSDRMESEHSIDPDKPIEELFSEYFHFKQNIPPNEEIISLFREILNSGGES